MCVYVVLKAYFEARKGGSVCYCFGRVKGRKLVGSGKDSFTILKNKIVRKKPNKQERERKIKPKKNK